MWFWKNRSKQDKIKSDEIWQQAALFRLSADLVAALGEEEIYPCVVECLHDTLGYDFLALFLLDQSTGYRELVANVGFINPHSSLQPGDGLSERPLIDGKLHYSPDVNAEQNYSYGMGGSEVDIPIFIGEKVMGVLVAERKEVDGFEQHDFDVLTAAAHITGIAIEKSRLLAKERHRVEEMAALREILTELTRELELPILLNSIVEKAAKLLKATGGELGLVDENRQEIQIVVSHNLGKNYVGKTQRVGEGIMGKVVETGESLIVDDYSAWSGKLPDYEGIYSSIGVPLTVGNRVLGVFTTVNAKKKKAFSKEDLHLLNSFGSQAAIAIENARLYDQAQKEIKERKKAQQEVSRQKEYYEALLVNNPVAVVTADLNGDIVSWNPMAEKLFGYSAGEVLGNPIDLFVANHESIKAEAKELTEQAIIHGPVHVSTKRTRKNGSLVDVELLALPVIVNEKKVGFITIYHDLTEIKYIERALRNQNLKMLRELELAGEIQASFLPRDLPDIHGWQFSTSIYPARETSGDFFDLRMLPNGKIGVLIADVVDKGVGAALFMALSWTLLRIYTDQYPDDPKSVFQKVNQRLLEDTKSSQFVTVFYGVIDPVTGEIIYCNSGHCPPVLMKNTSTSVQPELLIRTGMPLGISLDSTWNQRKLHIEKGDVFFLYTDGVIEAFNDQNSLYGEERVIQVLRDNYTSSSENIGGAVISDLNLFVGSEPQSDDIAMIIIKKESK